MGQGVGIPEEVAFLSQHRSETGTGVWHSGGLPLMGGSDFCDNYIDVTVTSIGKVEALRFGIRHVGLWKERGISGR